MKRKQEIGECIYCARIRVLTNDHVPPKCLFPRPRPSNLITVSSCQECNRSFMLDDEYFRLVIADARDPNVSPANFDHLLKAKQELFRPGKTASAWRLLLSRLDRSTGLLSVDRPRVERVLERIVRGLFFRRLDMRLPDTYGIEIWSDWFAQETRWSLQEIERDFSLHPATRIGKDVFEFRCLTPDSDPYVSLWYLLFYGHRRFIGFTAAKAALESNGH